MRYAYNGNNGALASVTDVNTNTVYWQANVGNALGQLTRESLGNGVVINRDFDGITGWVNYIHGGVGGGTGLQNETYLHDEIRNVISRSNIASGATWNTTQVSSDAVSAHLIFLLDRFLPCLSPHQDFLMRRQPNVGCL